jgi:hypothetical protein
LGAYALERCCRGGRWAAESRTLARRLQSLPQLAKALEAGSIGWSMAELLARHATPLSPRSPERSCPDIRDPQRQGHVAPARPAAIAKAVAARSATSAT